MNSTQFSQSAEYSRLAESNSREIDWQLWGTYLPDRQWGTVRECYAEDGDAWKAFPHDHARSRVYRWGDDGLFGWTDRNFLTFISFTFSYEILLVSTPFFYW